MTNTAFPFTHVEPIIARRGPRAGQAKRLKEDGTKHVTTRQLINAHNAFCFAHAQGYRLNTFVTVVFKWLRGSQGWKTGEPAPGQVRFQRHRLRKGIQRWCRRRAIPFAMIECIENKQGPGPHLHILLHLPENCEPRGNLRDASWHAHFEALTAFLDTYSEGEASELSAERAAIEKRTREGNSRLDDGAGGVPTKLPIYVSPRHLPHLYGDDSALRKLGYMGKCMSPHTIILDDGVQRQTARDIFFPFGDNLTLGESTVVYTRKRIGVSETISTSARAAAGWCDTTTLGWLDRSAVREELQISALEMLKVRMNVE